MLFIKLEQATFRQHPIASILKHTLGDNYVQTALTDYNSTYATLMFDWTTPIIFYLSTNCARPHYHTKEYATSVQIFVKAYVKFAKYNLNIPYHHHICNY
jgi:hypothetical protein